MAKDYYASMPRLALPFVDNTENKFSSYFRVGGIQSLIILGPNGKTLQTNAVDNILYYGIRAYTFTKELLDEFEDEDRPK